MGPNHYVDASILLSLLGCFWYALLAALSLGGSAWVELHNIFLNHSIHPSPYIVMLVSTAKATIAKFGYRVSKIHNCKVTIFLTHTLLLIL